MEILIRYGLIAVFLAIHPPLSSFVPEEISLLYAGFLAGTSRADLWLCWLVGWAGIVSADTLTWAVGRRVGLEPGGRMARWIGPRRIERMDHFYRRYGSWAVVLCRQLPGLRFPAFFFAGAAGFPLARFARFDMLAASLTAAVYVGLGATFAGDFQRVLDEAESVRTAILTGLGVVVALSLLFLLVRAMRARMAR